MKKQNITKTAFTLVEVLVSITIFSIMIISPSFASVDIEHPGHPPRRDTYIPGTVIYGPFLQCQLLNVRNHPIRVIDYSYDIWENNGRGGTYRYEKFLQCRYNCRVAANAFQNFTGPANNYRISYATCSARVR